jgi:iron complex transport system substrate-binding protein
VNTKLPEAPSQAVRKGFFVALVTVAVLVSGCAVGTAVVTLAPTASSVPTAASAPTPAYPLSLTGDDGVPVTLPAAPQKIVSLTPATTELALALGAGGRLKGRTASDDYPPQSAAIPVVASFNGVVIEQVVAIEPDLVIAGGNGFTAQADIDRLRGLGYPVLVVYAENVQGVLNDIRLVGSALGEDADAKSVADGIQSRIDEVEAAVGRLDRPRTFYEIGYQPEIYGPAPDSFVADMVNLAGGNPVTTTDPAVFSISLEQLVADDPQLIVLGDAAYGTCPPDVASRPGWESISAVTTDRIVPIDDAIVTRPGPRLGEGLASLALAIHAGAAIAPPVGATNYCTAQAGPTP